MWVEEARPGVSWRPESLGAGELGLGLIGPHCWELEVRTKQLGLESGRWICDQGEGWGPDVGSWGLGAGYGLRPWQE